MFTRCSAIQQEENPPSSTTTLNFNNYPTLKAEEIYPVHEAEVVVEESEKEASTQGFWRFRNKKMMLCKINPVVGIVLAPFLLGFFILFAIAASVLFIPFIWKFKYMMRKINLKQFTR